MPPPPKYPLRFLRWFCREEFLEEIEGNLVEIFDQEVKENPRKAKRAFVWTVLRHFRPAFIKSIQPKSTLIHPAMIRHNLLIAFRGFYRDKTSFAINIFGLSTGLACVFLIYLWINNELRIDRFHESDSQLYQVMNNYHGVEGIQTWEKSPMPLAQTLVEEFPEVENAVFSSRAFSHGIISFENQHIESQRLLAGEQFFDIFSYKLLLGDPKKALADKNGLLISESLAKKIFSSPESGLGKIIEWKNPYFERANRTFTIAGVFEDPPLHTTEHFDAIGHYELQVDLDPYSKQWNSTSGNTIVLLKEGADVAAFNEKIKNIRGEKDPSMEANTIFLQQYSQRYLHGRYENGKPVGGRIDYVRYFSILAFFILLIACINFMNFSTAQASKKLKEIGVKKTLGVRRNELAGQFLSETLILVGLASVIALGLSYFFLPQFNSLIGKAIPLEINFTFFLAIGGIVLVTGLLAGSYPAFYLSGFNPTKVLKGNRELPLSEQWVRKGLVIFQFALAAISIVGVIVLGKQLEYTQTKNLGFDRDHILTFQRPHFDEDPGPFLQAVNSIPSVVNAATMQGSILSGKDDQLGFSWSGDNAEREYSFKSPQIGYGLIETLDMNILAGRSFSKDYQKEEEKIIINEAALELMQLENPVGKRIAHGIGEKEIIGVVENFHYGSLHHSIVPLAFRLPGWGWGTNTLVKFKGGMEQKTIQQIEKLYEEFHPNVPFTYTFLDEDYQQLYVAESRTAIISKYACTMAIILSCLGLLGLTIFSTERRQKEIGIRKVLGASVIQIAHLLSKDFGYLILTAICIAIPVSFLLARNWLNQFAYQIDISLWYFVYTALGILLLAWGTIWLQTLTVARMNPVECLKDE